MPGTARRDRQAPESEPKGSPASPIELDIMRLDAPPEDRLVVRPVPGGGKVEYEFWDEAGASLQYKDWRRASGGEIRLYDADGFNTLEMTVGEPRKGRPDPV
jgi:hypothetical protein